MKRMMTGEELKGFMSGGRPVRKSSPSSPMRSGAKVIDSMGKKVTSDDLGQYLNEEASEVGRCLDMEEGVGSDEEFGDNGYYDNAYGDDDYAYDDDCSDHGALNGDDFVPREEFATDDFTMAVQTNMVSPEIARRKVMAYAASPSYAVEEDDIEEEEMFAMRQSGGVSEVDEEDVWEGDFESESTETLLIDVEKSPEKNEANEANEKKISTGEMRNLMELFGEEPVGDTSNGLTADSLPVIRLGPVLANSIKMLGPWQDLDEDDVMYAVPHDKDGKVKRRRRRNRHRFVVFRMSLDAIEEDEELKSRRKKKKEKEKKEAKAPPTVDDILYGFGGAGNEENDQNSGNANVPSSKPKTPTKPQTTRFNRRGNKIVKKSTAICVSDSLDLASTMDFGKTGALPVDVTIKRGQDTYAQWFGEQIGFNVQDVAEGDAQTEERLRLFEAVKRKELKSLETLMEGPVEHLKNVRDDYGNTLLMACCHSGFKRGVKLFVKHGLDINGCNQFGNTSMHFSIERGHDKIAEYLKRKGADDRLKNEMGLCCYERVSTDGEGSEEEVAADES